MELQERDFDLSALVEGISAMFAIRCEQKELTKGDDRDEEQRGHGSQAANPAPDRVHVELDAEPASDQPASHEGRSDGDHDRKGVRTLHCIGG